MNKPSSNTFPSSMKSPTLTTPYLPPLHSPNTRLMTRKPNVSTPMGGTGGGGSMASPSTTLLEFKLSDYTRSRGFMITTDMCKELDKPHIYYTEKSIDLIRKITERLESFQVYPIHHCLSLKKTFFKSYEQKEIK
ncbi:hypothetical protein HMI55_003606 [Coelomomyces lativittatus]|nr:hypothetical protein HMI55_003606 [Coelomomyces lativittatus]